MKRDHSQPVIAVIGAGNAGRALIAALSRHWPVTVFDRNAAQYRSIDRAAEHPITFTSDVQAAVADANLVILSLPTPAASLAVAGEIADSMMAGATLIETSTVAPADVEALVAAVGAETRVIDAAIVGGVAKLRAGEGTFLVGSPEDEAGVAGSVLRAISGELFFLAWRGDAMRAKISVNAVAHAVYVVLVEAGAMAVAQGIPLSVFQSLMERESGLMRPLNHRFGERLQSHDFAGGMPTRNAAKDSALALAAADEMGVPLRVIRAAHGAYEQAIAEGLGDLDYAALGTLWERALGISFLPPCVD